MDHQGVSKLFSTISGSVHDSVQTQILSTIERAFGVLVHRWFILWPPLAVLLQKMAPLVESLVQFYNFCINNSDNNVVSAQEKSAYNVRHAVWYSQLTGGNDAKLVNIDANSRPTSLLSHGHNFVDAKHNWHNKSGITPLDKVIKNVELHDL